MNKIILISIFVSIISHALLIFPTLSNSSISEDIRFTKTKISIREIDIKNHKSITKPVGINKKNKKNSKLNNDRDSVKIKEMAMKGDYSVRYPYESRVNEEEGSVRILFKIGIDGKTFDLKVIDSSGYDNLDRAALESVKSYQYKSLKIKEVVSKEVVVNFLLEDEK